LSYFVFLHPFEQQRRQSLKNDRNIMPSKTKVIKTVKEHSQCLNVLHKLICSIK